MPVEHGHDPGDVALPPDGLGRRSGDARRAAVGDHAGGLVRRHGLDLRAQRLGDRTRFGAELVSPQLRHRVQVSQGLAPVSDLHVLLDDVQMRLLVERFDGE